MQFEKVYLKEELQFLQTAEHQKDVMNCVERSKHKVLNAAKEGKKKVVFTPDDFKGIVNQGVMIEYPINTKITFEEFAEALKLKFPDSKVTLSSDEVQIQAGIREIRSKITVDWS